MKSINENTSGTPQRDEATVDEGSGTPQEDETTVGKTTVGEGSGTQQAYLAQQASLAKFGSVTSQLSRDVVEIYKQSVQSKELGHVTTTEFNSEEFKVKTMKLFFGPDSFKQEICGFIGEEATNRLYDKASKDIDKLTNDLKRVHETNEIDHPIKKLLDPITKIVAFVSVMCATLASSIYAAEPKRSEENRLIMAIGVGLAALAIAVDSFLPRKSLDQQVSKISKDFEQSLKEAADKAAEQVLKENGITGSVQKQAAKAQYQQKAQTFAGQVGKSKESQQLQAR